MSQEVEVKKVNKALLALTAVIAVSYRAECRRQQREAARAVLAAIAPLAVLADPEQERVVCGCSWWDSEADRLLLVPCAEHLEEMVMAGEAQ